MKKQILLMLSMVIMLACIFALSVSAETDLKPQDNNAYGDLSFFDESVTVGRTNTKYGFTPYIDAEGTTYARIVVGDGTTFYTFPTAYALSNTSIYGEGTRSIYHLDLTSLNNAVESVNGTNPGWTYKNVYRIELPYNMTYLNGGNNQAFKEYSNVVEIFLQPNTTTKDSNKQMLLFWNCKNLEVIHNLDTFVFKAGVSGGAFQNDAKLTNLTIGISPDMTTTQDSMFAGCTNLQSVNFKEAFPNLKTIGKQCFYQCTNLVSTSSEEGVVSLPDGVTQIGYQNNGSAFYECKAMKYLSLPASLTHVGATAFNNCTALEFVDFNDNPNDIEFYNYGHFMGCSSLKAVSLPDNVTVLNNRIFVSCTSLQAVYLPKNLVQMNTNGNGAGPFCYSKLMYFVNEPFEVRDENGNFLGDSFVMPAKPEVYFMPETLSSAGGNVSSGTWFRDCIGLNTTIVMPKAFTNSTVVQMFRETASANNIKNIVYLGDMETIAWSERNHHINFIFANPNDTDISSVTFSSFYNNLNSNCYFYFCSTGYKYTMAKASVDDVAATKEENQYWHVANPKETEETDATCTENKGVTTYCFCGEKIGTVEEENTALGHDHTIFIGLVYESFLKEGNYKYQCARCDDVNSEQKASALFTCLGYSAPEDGRGGIAIGYTVNNEAITEYEEVTGKTLNYGVFAVLKDRLGNNDVFAEDGTVAEGVINAEITNYEFVAFELKIVGFTDERKDTKLAMGAYVAVTDGETTEYSYLQSGTPAENEKYCFVSYNDVVGAPSTNEDTAQ